jgi:hypothetical protein
MEKSFMQFLIFFPRVVTLVTKMKAFGKEETIQSLSGYVAIALEASKEYK